jgi:hypothetical protein
MTDPENGVLKRLQVLICLLNSGGGLIVKPMLHKIVSKEESGENLHITFVSGQFTQLSVHPVFCPMNGRNNDNHARR